MAYVPINRARALIICTRPQDYMPARLREAARYLLDRRDATGEERRLATEAIELLRSRREEQSRHDGAVSSPEPPAESTQPAAKQKRKSRGGHA